MCLSCFRYEYESVSEEYGAEVDRYDDEPLDWVASGNVDRRSTSTRTPGRRALSFPTRRRDDTLGGYQNAGALSPPETRDLASLKDQSGDIHFSSETPLLNASALPEQRTVVIPAQAFDAYQRSFIDHTSQKMTSHPRKQRDDASVARREDPRTRALPPPGQYGTTSSVGSAEVPSLAEFPPNEQLDREIAAFMGGPWPWRKMKSLLRIS